jgi:hypothetical protein
MKKIIKILIFNLFIIYTFYTFTLLINTCKKCGGIYDERVIDLDGDGEFFFCQCNKNTFYKNYKEFFKAKLEKSLFYLIFRTLRKQKKSNIIHFEQNNSYS